MSFSIEKYYLHSSSFFESLTPEQEKAVRGSTLKKEVAKGDYLFEAGSAARGIYLLRKGKIKIFQVNRDGKESIASIYKPGDFFGYRPLLVEDPLHLSAKALEHSVLSIVPANLFFELLNSPPFSKKLLVHLSKEFTAWINKMTVFSQYGVRERVAMSLLILHEVYSDDNKTGKQTAIRISRDDFAAFVGTAKETLVRTLRQFKDERVISTKGTQIIIEQPDILLETVSEM